MDARNNYSGDCKAMAVLVKTMMAGVLIFCGISVLLYYSGNTPSEKLASYANLVLTICLVAGILALVVARYFYSRRMEALKDSGSTGKQKLERFRGLVITHVAICEMVALLGVVCFMTFGNFLFFILVALGLAEMMLKFPTLEKIDQVINSNAY
jgi:hypothetical protein